MPQKPKPAAIGIDSETGESGRVSCPLCRNTLLAKSTGYWSVILVNGKLKLTNHDHDAPDSDSDFVIACDCRTWTPGTLEIAYVEGE